MSALYIMNIVGSLKNQYFSYFVIVNSHHFKQKIILPPLNIPDFIYK